MGKHKRAGYIFQTWCGDHEPRHVHITKDGQFVAKFNLEKLETISGKVNRIILKALFELIREGKI